MVLRRFTLDTNCVIHGAQNQPFAPAMDALIDLARAGHISLWLATTFNVDQEHAPADKHQANLRWLQERPVIAQVPAPFRLDYSRLDGGDGLADEDHKTASEAIEKILLSEKYRVGNLRARDAVHMAKWRRKVNDVQHLTAHIMAGHDAFVTSDRDDMLKKRDRLHDQVGIVVLDPDEAVQFARGEPPHQ